MELSQRTSEAIRRHNLRIYESRMWRECHPKLFEWIRRQISSFSAQQYKSVEK